MYNKILKTVKDYKKSNITVFIVFKNYPNELSIKNICNKIQSFNPHHVSYSENNEKFILTIRNIVSSDKPLDFRFHSYQLTLISELHKNEKKNHFDKIDVAIANLQSFKQDDLNVVVIHVNQSMPIDSIEKYTEEYFENKKRNDIDAVAFYQPCITSDVQNTQLCHVIKLVLNKTKTDNNFMQTVKGKNWNPPEIIFPVGIISSESCKNALILDNKIGSIPNFV